MRRVLVIGSGGSGKSTLARRLGERASLPVIHLDTLYWRPGWTETPAEEWIPILEEQLGREAWVMDGNYSGTLDRRLAACDAVVFLDLPRLVCLWRVLRRRARYHGRSREDLSAGCPERLTWEFLRWIWTYPKRRRASVLARLGAVERDKQVVILRSAAEVAGFLERVPRRGREA
jgi:adenylate kinase family enzyme